MEKDFSNFLIKKEQKTFDVYYLVDGFVVEADYSEDFTNFFLYHKQYGIKQLMFGLPNSNGKAENEKTLIANLPEYIEDYREEYMDR